MQNNKKQQDKTFLQHTADTVNEIQKIIMEFSSHLPAIHEHKEIIRYQMTFS